MRAVVLLLGALGCEGRPGQCVYDTVLWLEQDGPLSIDGAPEVGAPIVLVTDEGMGVSTDGDVQLLEDEEGFSLPLTCDRPCAVVPAVPGPNCRPYDATLRFELLPPPSWGSLPGDFPPLEERYTETEWYTGPHPACLWNGWCLYPELTEF